MCTECILNVVKKNEKKKTGIYIRQNIEMFFIQFLPNMTLSLRTGKIDYLFFYAFLRIVIFSSVILCLHDMSGVDRCLLNNMSLLITIGFTILTRLDFQKAFKQFGIVTVSIAITMVVHI